MKGLRLLIFFCYDDIDPVPNVIITKEELKELRDILNDMDL